ncbi:hypothetical protein ACM26S_09925 [Kluyvera sichuanensis]|uniref:hypothetical protein n=1 Tax=Kluyvera sichuanensis TaxID=2725494 RepID=UPI0039F6D4FD
MDDMNMWIWMIKDPGIACAIRSPAEQSDAGDPTDIKKPAEAGFFIIQPRT